jgi:putative tryptophan/tyrosine transport system substrate-binding protein
MRRREFIAGLGGAAAWPVVARAQRLGGRVYRIGYVGTNRDFPGPLGAPIYRAFLGELQKDGFRIGQNLSEELRSGERSLDALTADAAEFVRSNVDVLVTDGTETALKAAISATKSVPIVMIATNFDPLERGYVNSMTRPGGNVTGVFLNQSKLAERQTELLSQAVPDRDRLCVLYDTISIDQSGTAERVAKALNLEVHSFELGGPPYEFETTFRILAETEPEMLLVLSNPKFPPARTKIAELAIRYGWPTMFAFKTYVQAGGLLAYGADYVAMHRQAAACVAKILIGANPGDIPIEQPSNFDLAINLKTAKALGLKIPSTLLARADEVIE